MDYNGTSSTNGSPLANYDKLKQELIVEFRKELQSFKSDIINCKQFYCLALEYFFKSDLIFYLIFSYSKRAEEIKEQA